MISVVHGWPQALSLVKGFLELSQRWENRGDPTFRNLNS